jgi:hypothetical protein
MRQLPRPCQHGAAGADGDGRGNACDNCPWLANASQSDADKDGIGDACDTAPPPSGGGTTNPPDNGSTTPDNGSPQPPDPPANGGTAPPDNADQTPPADAVADPQEPAAPPWLALCGMGLSDMLLVTVVGLWALGRPARNGIRQG